jgi:hypothetical protein
MDAEDAAEVSLVQDRHAGAQLRSLNHAKQDLHENRIVDGAADYNVAATRAAT